MSEGAEMKRHPPVGVHGRGFSLVELLVVVSVIAILAALLLPSLGTSIKTAKTAHCQSNLRQIAAAFVLYYKHYDGLMCPSGSPSRKPPHRYPRWYKNLEPFAGGSLGIFRCPSKQRAKWGYGLNHMWCGPDEIYPGAAMNDRAKEFDMVTNPSGTVIICDTAVVTNPDDPPEDWIEKDAANTNGCCRFPYDNRPGEPGTYTWWRKDPRRAVPRHFGRKTNCMFFDSHVKAIETADIVDDLWDEPGCIYDNDGCPKRK